MVLVWHRIRASESLLPPLAQSICTAAGLVGEQAVPGAAHCHLLHDAKQRAASVVGFHGIN